MSISVVELYRDILPRTNCGDCGKPSCMAFATIVVTEKYPIDKCPHLDGEKLIEIKEILEKQYAEGKYLKKDNKQEALEWARQRASSMDIQELPVRIGGNLLESDSGPVLELPYFNGSIFISNDKISGKDGADLTRYEQVFIYNHIAQGGSSLPSGVWKGFEEFPNTVSKIKSMIDHVEKPIEKKFDGKIEELKTEGKSLGGIDITDEIESSDLSLEFHPLPRIPIRLIFRDGIQEDGIDADVKLLFDKTVTEHLDIESIMFLSERLRELLCGDAEGA